MSINCEQVVFSCHHDSNHMYVFVSCVSFSTGFEGCYMYMHAKEYNYERGMDSELENHNTYQQKSTDSELGRILHF